jgi:hypothetical protein
VNDDFQTRILQLDRLRELYAMMRATDPSEDGTLELLHDLNKNERRLLPKRISKAELEEILMAILREQTAAKALSKSCSKSARFRTIGKS